MDENEFFRQAALQILSSLDLSKAMGRCFSYLSLVMPVDWMSLHLYSVLPSSCRCHLHLQHQKFDPDVKITTLLQQLPLRITIGSQSTSISGFVCFTP